MYLVRGSYDSEASLIDDSQNEKRIVINDNKGCLNYISKSKKKVVILRPEEDVEVKIEPKFWLQFPYKSKYAGGRFVNLVELIELLKKNGRQFVGFSFELVCKNGVEDVQDSVSMAKFGFDLTNHRTLEDAKKQGYPLNFLPLDGNEIETRIGAINYEVYNNTKSIKNHIPGEDYGDAENMFTKMK